MLTVLLVLPVVLSFLLFGAHLYFHTGSFPLALAGGAVPIVLLFVPQAWAARVVQVLLIVAALEWLRTLVVGVDVRVAREESWTRYVIILGSVTAFTLVSGFVFHTRRLRRWYFGEAGAVPTPGSGAA